MAEKKYEIGVYEWQGQPTCIYLNDFRIAGPKPWGGGDCLAAWNVTVKDLTAAIPEFALLPDLIEAGKSVLFAWAEGAEDLDKEMAELRSALLKAKGGE